MRKIKNKMDEYFDIDSGNVSDQFFFYGCMSVAGFSIVALAVGNLMFL